MALSLIFHIEIRTQINQMTTAKCMLTRPYRFAILILDVSIWSRFSQYWKYKCWNAVNKLILMMILCPPFSDNTRRFCVWKEHGGCPNDKAWMAILDSSDSSQPCSWDKNVQSRPYFLYSKKSTWALCESGMH